ncbi:5,6-dimethylbenzimidazole synthase [Magnetococcus sp. PR-3]|uniref:5,6-dimethylbenzimidazole synthase n=1 Tax=Magnetococcus sp. PR-3 TaxID=3120355 RepID=UPI002FCE5342
MSFTPQQQHAIYETIFKRRDVRSEFLPDPIPDDVLSRLLLAAHHAPSVGFMQPWNFLVIRDQKVKQQMHQAFEKANSEAAEKFENERAQMYRSLKLQGIMEAPINLCITCDRDRCGPVVLGRTHMPETDLYSSVCAVQNLWLAARAEDVGVGWVSIVDPDALKSILNIQKDNIVPVAYLCIGYVSHFHETPELAQKGWRQRLDPASLIYYDQWGEQQSEESLTQALHEQQQRLIP